MFRRRSTPTGSSLRASLIGGRPQPGGLRARTCGGEKQSVTAGRLPVTIAGDLSATVRPTGAVMR